MSLMTSHLIYPWKQSDPDQRGMPSRENQWTVSPHCLLSVSFFYKGTAYQQSALPMKRCPLIPNSACVSEIQFTAMSDSRVADWEGASRGRKTGIDEKEGGKDKWKQDVKMKKDKNERKNGGREKNKESDVRKAEWGEREIVDSLNAACLTLKQAL